MDSMEQIYRKYAKNVYGFLLTKTQNPDLAEELTQETFYQAVKGIDNFKGKSSVSTWLCGIAKNIWYEYMRKQKNQVSLEEASEVSVNSAEADFFKAWSNMNVLKVLHKLKDPMREVMYLRLIGNLTFRQIGEIMDKSENWARVTYYRGKEIVIKEAGL
ncbi:RNA polymerase subunit sigma [Anaerocolumna cellulosilytica]|uniref:RNA polymerase subunit sigma n=1 Tax=Anaerocolumna cellulosilytica TaxID=433286 RepID=A0A6S6QYB1_9FIRM|nr:sigma-70 family RNA polymerase sigma factor [Anaerocolumna cellulosilytica]BCJ92867.1 RNA polymerase subunit sigma [Anaerocolumna cellulosilytica]